MAKNTCLPAAPSTQPRTITGRDYRERLLRIDDVCFLTGLGRSTVYARVKGGDFPQPVQLHGACVAWRETEVDTWIAARPAVAALVMPTKARRQAAA
jgi:prophage regulatory protein